MSLLTQICEYSIWKPLRGPVENSPLALCDRRTVRAEECIANDIVSDLNATATETYHLHHSPHHKWYYISGQTDEEAWIFQQTDSRLFGQGVPHTSFEDPAFESDGTLPRGSIEVRIVAYFAD